MVVRAVVWRGLSIDLGLLLIWKRVSSQMELGREKPYCLIRASRSTSACSVSRFRGLGILIIFVGADSSRLNQSENSDLLPKSFSSCSLITRAAE